MHPVPDSKGRPKAGGRTVALIAGDARSLLNFRGRLLEACVQRGHRVHAFAPGAPPPGLEAMGVHYHRWSIDRTGVGLAGNARGLWQLREALRLAKADVVLAYSTKAVALGCLAAAAAGVPRIYAMVTGLGYLFQEAGREDPWATHVRRWVLARAARPLFRAALSRTCGVFVQNGDDEADLRRWHMLPASIPCVRIAGSGVDLERFAETPVPHEGPPVFLFVGRLLRDKGLGEFVDAARRLRGRFGESVRMVVVGPFDGNPSQVSEAELERWITEGVITYGGEVEDIRPWLQQCSVMVLPSYREGLPRSVLEAMASGRAIVTTDAPGCRETVDDGHNGFLVPVRDPAALAEAMARFVEQPALMATMGRRSRALAASRFDVHAVNARLLETMRL